MLRLLSRRSSSATNRIYLGDKRQIKLRWKYMCDDLCMYLYVCVCISIISIVLYDVNWLEINLCFGIPSYWLSVFFKIFCFFYVNVRFFLHSISKTRTKYWWSIWTSMSFNIVHMHISHNYIDINIFIYNHFLYCSVFISK